MANSQKKCDSLLDLFSRKRQANSPVVSVVVTLLQAIQNGQFAPGEKLPSIRRLSDLFRVSKNTVSDAIDLLMAQGFVHTEPNRGVFVSLSQSGPSDVWDRFFAGPHKALSSIQRHESWKESGLLSEVVDLSFRMNEKWDDYASFKLIAPFIKKAVDNHVKGKYRDLFNDRGLPVLREELAKWLSRSGIETNPNQILVVSRRVHAYKLIMDLFSSRDVYFGVQRENFFNAYPSGMTNVFKRVELDTDSEGLVIDRLLGIPGKRILFIQPTRNEPNGTMTYQERREKIYAACLAAHIPIIEEGVAAPFYNGRRKVRPIKTLDKAGIVIHIGGFREGLIPGVSLEWIVAPENIVGRLVGGIRKDISPAAEINQMVVTELLRSDKLDDLYRDVNAIYEKKFSLFAAIVDKYFSGIASYGENQVWGRIWLTFDKSIKVSALYAARKTVDFQPGVLYGDMSDSSVMLYLYGDVTVFEEGIRRLRELVYEIYQI